MDEYNKAVKLSNNIGEEKMSRGELWFNKITEQEKELYFSEEYLNAWKEYRRNDSYVNNHIFYIISTMIYVIASIIYLILSVF